MRRTQTRGLVAAMENEELNNNPAPAADEQAVEVAEASTELSDEIVEVTEAAAEGEAADAQVEEATEVAEALESLADAIGVAASNGGLNRQAAAAMSIAVEHMYNRVGIAAQPMPALESFGGTSSMVGATNLAMEDIKEQAAKIWAAIVAAINKAIAWAEDFFNKIFGSAEKLEKRADALQAKAEGITGTAKEKQFENEGLVKRLHVQGKVGGIATHMTAIESTAKGVFQMSKDFSETIGTEIIKGMESEGAEKTFAASFKLNAAPTTVGKALSNPEDAGFGAAPEGLSVIRSEELPGGMAIVTRAPTSAMTGEAALNAIRAVGSKIEPFDGSKAKAPTEKKVDVLATADMVKVCKTVAAIAAQLKGFRGQAAKIKELKKKFAAAASKAQKSVTGAEAEAKEGFKAIQKAASQYPRFADQPAASFSVYALNAAKAALDYVEASAKQYGAAAK